MLASIGLALRLQLYTSVMCSPRYGGTPILCRDSVTVNPPLTQILLLEASPCHHAGSRSRTRIVLRCVVLAGNFEKHRAHPCARKSRASFQRVASLRSRTRNHFGLYTEYVRTSCIAIADQTDPRMPRQMHMGHARDSPVSVLDSTAPPRFLCHARVRCLSLPGPVATPGI